MLQDWNWWAYHYRVVHRGKIPGIERWDDDLADTKLPLVPYDRDHYGNLVIVARKG